MMRFAALAASYAPTTLQGGSGLRERPSLRAVIASRRLAERRCGGVSIPCPWLQGEGRWIATLVGLRQPTSR